MAVFNITYTWEARDSKGNLKYTGNCVDANGNVYSIRMRSGSLFSYNNHQLPQNIIDSTFTNSAYAAQLKNWYRVVKSSSDPFVVQANTTVIVRWKPKSSGGGSSVSVIFKDGYNNENIKTVQVAVGKALSTALSSEPRRYSEQNHSPAFVFDGWNNGSETRKWDLIKNDIIKVNTTYTAIWNFATGADASVIFKKIPNVTGFPNDITVPSITNTQHKDWDRYIKIPNSSSDNPRIPNSVKDSSNKLYYLKRFDPPPNKENILNNEKYYTNIKKTFNVNCIYLDSNGNPPPESIADNSIYLTPIRPIRIPHDAANVYVEIKYNKGSSRDKILKEVRVTWLYSTYRADVYPEKVTQWLVGATNTSTWKDTAIDFSGRDQEKNKSIVDSFEVPAGAELVQCYVEGKFDNAEDFDVSSKVWAIGDPYTSNNIKKRYFNFSKHFYGPLSVPPTPQIEYDCRDSEHELDRFKLSIYGLPYNNSILDEQGFYGNNLQFAIIVEDGKTSFDKPIYISDCYPIKYPINDLHIDNYNLYSNLGSCIASIPIPNDISSDLKDSIKTNPLRILCRSVNLTDSDSYASVEISPKSNWSAPTGYIYSRCECNNPLDINVFKDSQTKDWVATIHYYKDRSVGTNGNYIINEEMLPNSVDAIQVQYVMDDLKNFDNGDNIGSLTIQRDPDTKKLKQEISLYNSLTPGNYFFKARNINKSGGSFGWCPPVFISFGDPPEAPEVWWSFDSDNPLNSGSTITIFWRHNSSYIQRHALVLLKCTYSTQENNLTQLHVKSVERIINGNCQFCSFELSDNNVFGSDIIGMDSQIEVQVLTTYLDDVIVDSEDPNNQMTVVPDYSDVWKENCSKTRRKWSEKSRILKAPCCDSSIVTDKIFSRDTRIDNNKFPISFNSRIELISGSTAVLKPEHSVHTIDLTILSCNDDISYDKFFIPHNIKENEELFHNLYVVNETPGTIFSYLISLENDGTSLLSILSSSSTIKVIAKVTFWNNYVYTKTFTTAYPSNNAGLRSFSKPIVMNVTHVNRQNMIEPKPVYIFNRPLFDDNIISLYIEDFSDFDEQGYYAYINKQLKDDSWVTIWGPKLITKKDEKQYTDIIDIYSRLDRGIYSVMLFSKSLPKVCGYLKIEKEYEDYTYYNYSGQYIRIDYLTGKSLIFPYNIVTSNTVENNCILVNYVGRKYPIGYFGDSSNENPSWTFEIPKYEQTVLDELYLLQHYKGEVFIREPSGIGYLAIVSVSFNKSYSEVLVSVTLTANRLDTYENANNLPQLIQGGDIIDI